MKSVGNVILVAKLKKQNYSKQNFKENMFFTEMYASYQIPS